MNIPEDVKKLITLALEEDIGIGDITTTAIFQKGKTASANFIAKENGIIAGVDLADSIFQLYDPSIKFDANFKDGDNVSSGDTIAVARGPVNSLLTTERTVLNFMQRMSGIATKTNKYVKAISHTHCKVLDTRKTIPGHRYLDKLAVRLGGGSNHRFRLDDMFLIKENHINAAGGITNAINSCIKYSKMHGINADIEIEVTNLDEIVQVIRHGKINSLLLDNMSISMLNEAVKLIDNKFITEASGNVSIETIGKIAETGVNYISVGSLTHSVNALDISLIFN